MADAPKPLVQNAADAGQVREAKQKEKYGRDQQLADLRSVLSTPQGRRVLWRLLEHCSVFKSIWHPSAQIHHNAGRQDVGHFLMYEITEAQPDAFVQMMQEAKAQEKKHG